MQKGWKELAVKEFLKKKKWALLLTFLIYVASCIIHKKCELMVTLSQETSLATA